MFIFYLQGMKYFISRGLLKDNPYEIARFLDGTAILHKTKVRQFLQSRQDVVEYLVSFQNYANTFLPNALRRFFSKLEAPNDRGNYLQVNYLNFIQGVRFFNTCKYFSAFLRNFLSGFVNVTRVWG